MKIKNKPNETISFELPTAQVLVSYLLIYQSLTHEGKKMAQDNLKIIGDAYDFMKSERKKIWTTI